MRILIDTNVLLDYIANRTPYANDAEQIIILCKDDKIDGCIAAHSMMNILYILRKNMTVSERKEILFYLERAGVISGFPALLVTRGRGRVCAGNRIPA